jgi:hypothetical protein
MTAQRPLWSGRGGDLIPTRFLIVVDHHPVATALWATALKPANINHRPEIGF